jgi:hypothetical protein
LEKISSEFLKDLRNNLGGHVPQMAVADALKRMNSDRTALIEISADGKVGSQHYRFASELVLQMMLPRTPVTNPTRVEGKEPEGCAYDLGRADHR